MLNETHFVSIQDHSVSKIYKILTKVFSKYVQLKIITTIIIRDRWIIIISYIIFPVIIPAGLRDYITNLFEYKQKLRESLYSFPWLLTELTIGWLLSFTNCRNNFDITFIKNNNEHIDAHNTLFTIMMPNKLQNPVMSVSLVWRWLHLNRWSRLLRRIFFCPSNLQTRAIYTFSSTNIHSKRELLITSEIFSAIFFSSMPLDILWKYKQKVNIIRNKLEVRTKLKMQIYIS